MKKIIAILSCFWLVYCSQAQLITEINVDSLKHLLQSAKEDTAKVSLLQKLHAYYIRIDKDTSFVYVQQEILLSQKLNYRWGISDGYGNLGYWYYLQGNNPKSLEYNYKALRIAEEIKDSSLIGNTYNNIGHVFREEKNYREALKYYRKFYTCLPANASQYDKALALTNAAGVFLLLRKPDSALQYAEQGYQLFRTASDKTWMTPSLQYLAVAQCMMGNQALGDAYFQMAIENAVETNNFLGLGRVYYSAAEEFQKENNIDSAFRLEKKALAIFQKLNNKTWVAKSYSVLVELFQAKRQVDSAYFYQSKMIALNDSIAEENSLSDMENINFEERLREQEKIAEENNAKEERERNLQYAAIAFILISFLILFFVFSHSVIANQKLIRFLGILSLLMVFEFINLFIHPYMENLTSHSIPLMLGVMVCVAALLIPIHHRMEHWITHKLVEKNKKIRLEAAKKTIAKLEAE